MLLIQDLKYHFGRIKHHKGDEQVLTTLTDIKYSLEAIIYITQFCNGISDILTSLDVDTWYNLVEGEAIANLIIEDYKSY